jgi:rubrerythrin
MVSRRKFFWLSAGLLGTVLANRRVRADMAQQSGSCGRLPKQSSSPPLSIQHEKTDIYPITIKALKAAHQDEIQSYQLYSAFADTALADHLPGVAHLFRTFAVCELITARNFNNILQDLDVQYHASIEKLQVKDTKDNLKSAIRLELREIEEHYPKLIRRIKKEGHINALAATQHAFDSRKQHHALLVDMKNAMGVFYTKMVDRIEKERLRFFICDICGSVATEQPQRACCICENPAYFYKEVPSPV